MMQLHSNDGEKKLPCKKLRRGILSDLTIGKYEKYILFSPNDFASQNCAASNCDGIVDSGVEGGSLASRLRLDTEKDKDFVPLPGPLLRKYITYARNFIFPR